MSSNTKVKECKIDICYGCGNPIKEHTPNSNTWTHLCYQDCNRPVRPIIPPNERSMNWQADETAQEYKARVKHYYDGVIS